MSGGGRISVSSRSAWSVRASSRTAPKPQRNPVSKHQKKKEKKRFSLTLKFQPRNIEGWICAKISPFGNH